jgi:hypothetical protein
MLTSASVVQCAHVGAGTPSAPNPRVMLGGLPSVTLATTYAIAGCTFPAMTGGGSPPCLTGQFTTAATRVLATGQPVLLADSQGTSIPNGTPLIVMPSQPRVIAQ